MSVSKNLMVYVYPTQWAFLKDCGKSEGFSVGRIMRRLINREMGKPDDFLEDPSTSPKGRRKLNFQSLKICISRFFDAPGSEDVWRGSVYDLVNLIEKETLHVPTVFTMRRLLNDLMFASRGDAVRCTQSIGGRGNCTIWEIYPEVLEYE